MESNSECVLGDWIMEVTQALAAEEWLASDLGKKPRQTWVIHTLALVERQQRRGIQKLAKSTSHSTRKASTGSITVARCAGT
jgi:hypothetical protein